MTSEYNQWHLPYTLAKEFNKKVAYFSMEFGIHQALKIYSGGLGFLAGSHMRSGFELKQTKYDWYWYAMEIWLLRSG